MGTLCEIFKNPLPLKFEKLSWKGTSAKYLLFVFFGYLFCITMTFSILCSIMVFFFFFSSFLGWKLKTRKIQFPFYKEEKTLGLIFFLLMNEILGFCTEKIKEKSWLWLVLRVVAEKDEDLEIIRKKKKKRLVLWVRNSNYLGYDYKLFMGIREVKCFQD